MSHILDSLAIIFYGLSALYFGVRFFSKKDKTKTLAFLFLLLGFVTHTIDLLVFSFEHHRFPGSNLVEAFSALTCLTVLLFLGISRKEDMGAAAIVLLPLTILSIVLKLVVPVQEEKIEPIVAAGWIYVHIPLMILSVAALTISFFMAIMYLIQERQLKAKTTSTYLERLPSLQSCEELSYRSLSFGFFLLTFGILTGIIWSRYLRGVYWNWDYKEIWSLITWALYAVLLHGRILSAWRGRKAAYLAILGFVLILFTFAGVSLIFKVYHSF